MEFVELSKLCKMKSGGTPSRKKVEYYNGNFPWAKISDLENSNDGYIYDTEEKITIEALSSINKRVFEKGTLLLAMYGSVGKTAIAGIKLSTNQAILGLNIIDKTKLDISYLKYWFLNTKESLLNRAVGGTLQNISKTIVSKLKIPLPPLLEQQRIARLLDEADKLRQLNQQLIQKYEQLTQSLFLEMFGDPVTNPKGWEKVKLGDLGIWKSGGTPSRKNNLYFQGNIPWVSSGELNNIFIDNSIEKITNLAIEESNTKIIEKGSILLGMYDTAALKSSINTVEICCNQAIAYSKVKKEVVNTIFLYFNIQIAKEYLKKIQRGVRQKNLNLSMIKSIKIPLPPLDLQNQFAERVGLIEAQKQQAQEALQKSEDLFNSLLQKVFKP